MIKTVSDKFPVLGNENPPLVDLRGLEAPLPMEKVLIACAQLEAGQYFLAHLPRNPIMLFPHLKSRGLHWWVYEEADQSALLLIRADPESRQET